MAGSGGRGLNDRIQVEVVGPAGRRWLALPATRPVGDLLPAVLPLLAGTGDRPGTGDGDGEGWALAPPVGRPLAAGASLRACGIRPGSTLCLVSSRLAEDAEGVLPPHALVGMRTPLERTASALPRPLTRWVRARAAFALARERGVVRPSPPPPPAAPGAAPHPARFTQFRPEPLWRRGWRAWRELDHLSRLESAIIAPRLRRNVTVAVVSPLPGTGRTIVASLLGTLLAHLRRDRIVAVDPAPGAGSLVAFVVPGPARSLDALIGRVAESALTLSDLDANLMLGSHGLRVHRVHAGRDGTAGTGALDQLRRVAGVLLVDCEPGLDGAVARAAVGAADQVLVVTEAGPEARAALGPAVERVRGEARSVLIVANAPRSRAGARDAGRLAVCAPDAQGLVELPWSPDGAAQLAAGSFDWRHAPGAWRRATLELAAVLVDDWARLGLLV